MPAQKWTLPAGVHVKPSQFLGRRLFVFPNGTLYVKNVSPADAGRYEICMSFIYVYIICVITVS